MADKMTWDWKKEVVVKPDWRFDLITMDDIERTHEKVKELRDRAYWRGLAHGVLVASVAIGTSALVWSWLVPT